MNLTVKQNLILVVSLTAFSSACGFVKPVSWTQESQNKQPAPVIVQGEQKSEDSEEKKSKKVTGSGKAKRSEEESGIDVEEEDDASPQNRNKTIIIRTQDAANLPAQAPHNGIGTLACEVNSPSSSAQPSLEIAIPSGAAVVPGTIQACTLIGDESRNSGSNVISSSNAGVSNLMGMMAYCCDYVTQQCAPLRILLSNAYSSLWAHHDATEPAERNEGAPTLIVEEILEDIEDLEGNDADAENDEVPELKCRLIDPHTEL
jgi:hypothetical protein